MLWSQDGAMRQINPVTESRYTLINGKLIIHDPRDTMDNGDYQCKMNNAVGSLLSTIVQLSFGCKFISYKVFKDIFVI